MIKKRWMIDFSFEKFMQEGTIHGSSNTMNSKKKILQQTFPSITQTRAEQANKA